MNEQDVLEKIRVQMNNRLITMDEYRINDRAALQTEKQYAKCSGEYNGLKLAKQIILDLKL